MKGDAKHGADPLCILHRRTAAAAHTHSEAHGIAYTGTHTYAYTHSHAYPDTHSNPHPQAHRHPGTGELLPHVQERHEEGQRG